MPKITTKIHPWHWPATCPKDEATRVEREKNFYRRNHKLTFHYEKWNLHSGERFTVAIHATMGMGREFPTEAVILLQQ